MEKENEEDLGVISARFAMCSALKCKEWEYIVVLGSTRCYWLFLPDLFPRCCLICLHIITTMLMNVCRLNSLWSCAPHNLHCLC